MRYLNQILLLGLLLGIVTGCRTAYPRAGTPLPRQGDEIVVAGQLFHTGTRVVLWMDPGGYDAYRVERRFGPLDQADWKTSSATNKNLQTPNRYGTRRVGLTPAQREQVRGGGWDLPLLQKVVDQFVLHYDVCGTSRTCFRVLQDERDLSVHFMLDLDGTIYQTLDLKERAWHATIANDRSIGVEIANIGAYPVGKPNPLADWYRHNPDGTTDITLPERFGDGGILTPNFHGHPAHPEPVVGNIQGRDLVQYDFTPQQYEALKHLIAALCRVFPKIHCQYPVDANGQLIPHALTNGNPFTACWGTTTSKPTRKIRVRPSTGRRLSGARKEFSGSPPAVGPPGPGRRLRGERVAMLQNCKKSHIFTISRPAEGGYAQAHWFGKLHAFAGLGPAGAGYRNPGAGVVWLVFLPLGSRDMRFVAVTACPTGIAQAYLAAAQLEKAARKLGHVIKVETQGAVGIENQLSQAEVDNADGVIIASDIPVEHGGRFLKAPRVTQVPVQLALKSPETIFVRLQCQAA